MSAPEDLASPLPISPRVLTGLRWLLAAVSVGMVALFLVTALRRMGWAFEYDWIEDGVLASVRHLRAGLPLYGPPSVRFTPYLYTPIYLYAATALSWVTGVSYRTLRLLSIGSTLGCLAAIYWLVRRESQSALAALAAVGLFAACYPVVQGAFDLGRVDMLYLALVLWAFCATRRGHPLLAAVLWVLAFQTKQGVLPIAVLALAYDWQRPRRMLLGLGSFAALLLGSIAWLNAATHGWYRYYVFGLAGSFGIVRSQAVDFLRGDLVRPLSTALLVMVVAVLAASPQGPARRWLRSPAVTFYALGSVGMVAFTGYLRAHRGANLNSLLPMYAWLAVLFGLALARLLADWERRASPLAATATAVLLVLAALQLLQHAYLPAHLLPSACEQAEREAFEQQLRRVPGEVLVLGHPEDALLAGKSLWAGSESIGAVIEASNQQHSRALVQQYRQLLQSGELAAVALDQPAAWYQAYLDRGQPVWMPADFLQRYPLRVPAAGAPPADDERLGSEPRWLYLPCRSLALAQALDPQVDASSCAGR